LYKDGIDLVDTIKIKISATLEDRFYLDDPLILSTVYPGWGDYKLRPRKPYWINGALGFTFAGASVGMYYNSKNNYQNYLDANTVSDKNKFYNNAVLSKNLRYTFMGVAGTIWLMDYIRLIKRKNEIKVMQKKVLPVKENPNIPGFKIVSALSNNVFVNTRLTNLELNKNSVKYVDLDGNSCLDAFEEGFVEFELFNRGPAKAVSFYAKVHTINNTDKIKYPDSLLISAIAVNQTKTVRFPIRAAGSIQNGEIPLSVTVSALYNKPTEPFRLNVPSCAFEYKAKIEPSDLVSDVDINIPVLPADNIERFALIIGNEGYANEHTGLSKNFNVPFARNDALAFKRYAINILGVKEQNILLLLDANKKEMSENIQVLTNKVKQMKNNAELIFYFAGHGLSDTSTTAPYLMPVDISPDKINQGVSLDSLYKRIADCRPIKGLVILDAAFNNSGRNIGLRGKNAPKFQHRPEVIPTNTVVFAAVWKNSDIVAYKQKSHGLFTYAILKTLRDTKGKISFLQFDNMVNNEMLSVTKIPNENRATTTFYSKDISDIWLNWMFR